MDKFSEIDERRERLGIKQNEMCRLADVSPSTLTRARSGGKDPTPRILRKLRVALDGISRERGVALREDLERRS
ncbi:helix-turn-helix transcriptional regulator [Agrobacterium vitis]|uniref:helix-turn-helix domain-containing protein n=1 Tax=Agrobacterium vitis TaxID=373 RepID=UPI0012E88FA3|nr:helix-turn-helix transcriptional regulator [Agrobacterium vitis]MVA23193.1 helix-turn-helix domain-containing protein [Agrobacterium vitis]MVA33634.1 helix-turn-helix domain-containing protein [Agrobacterium vitis]